MVALRLARWLGRRPAVYAALIAGFHVGHLSLGLSAEGLEAALLQIVQSDSHN